MLDERCRLLMVKDGSSDDGRMRRRRVSISSVDRLVPKSSRRQNPLLWRFPLPSFCLSRCLTFSVHILFDSPYTRAGMDSTFLVWLWLRAKKKYVTWHLSALARCLGRGMCYKHFREVQRSCRVLIFYAIFSMAASSQSANCRSSFSRQPGPYRRMAQITDALESVQSPRKVNNQPLPTAAINGAPAMAPTHDRMFRQKLFNATPEDDRRGMNSVSIVVAMAKMIMLPRP